MGILPCTCACWSGAKAPKISTISSQVRANAAPYMTNVTSGTARSCIQCKIKMDQEQHQHLQMRQQQLNNQLNNNCSHQQHSHQHHHHCHCSANVPPIMTFPVPPPPLPTTVPTFLPTTPQPSTSAMMSGSNQMYFVPFNVPSIMTGAAPPITTNQMPPSAANICPHHPQLQTMTASKTYAAKSRSVPSLRSTAAAAVYSRRDSHLSAALPSGNLKKSHKKRKKVTQKDDFLKWQYTCLNCKCTE